MPRIVIADDDALVVELVTFKLMQRGYEVNSLTDGESILDNLLASPPDLIILDYQLSSTSTGEIIATLHANPATADIPVIILSSAWREQDVMEALEAGINDFMTKPFSPNELLLRVDLALRKARPPRALT
jgi:two-component system, OmpR family, phosphate regulon response regulator PhoB